MFELLERFLVAGDSFKGLKSCMRVFEKALRLRDAFEQITMTSSHESFLVAGGCLLEWGSWLHLRL